MGVSSPSSAIRVLTRFAHGVERVVVDLAARDDWRLLVEQIHQTARDARLRLAALAQQHDVLPGENRVLDLRNDTILVADDAGEQLLIRANLADQVLAHLLLDGLDAIAALTKLAYRCRLVLVGVRHKGHELLGGSSAVCAESRAGARRAAGGQRGGKAPTRTHISGVRRYRPSHRLHTQAFYAAT